MSMLAALYTVVQGCGILYQQNVPSVDAGTPAKLHFLSEYKSHSHSMSETSYASKSAVLQIAASTLQISANTAMFIRDHTSLPS